MSMTTRAAVCREPGRPWEITELELDDPQANEVRIKFMAAGLCHSDDHIQKGAAPMRMPVVGGHEGAGVVESVGPHVRRVKTGDRIVCAYIPACGACRPCSTGHQNMCATGRNAAMSMVVRVFGLWSGQAVPVESSADPVSASPRAEH